MAGPFHDDFGRDAHREGLQMKVQRPACVPMTEYLGLVSLMRSPFL